MSTDRQVNEKWVTVFFQVGFWIPLLGCTYFALVPEPPDSPVFHLNDVILHGAAFSFLTLALVLAQYGISSTRQSLYVRTFVLMLAYGILLELVQASIPERTAELKDLLVDSAGIGIGLMLAAAFAGPIHGLAMRFSARL